MALLFSAWAAVSCVGDSVSSWGGGVYDAGRTNTSRRGHRGNGEISSYGEAGCSQPCCMMLVRLAHLYVRHRDKAQSPPMWNKSSLRTCVSRKFGSENEKQKSITGETNEKTTQQIQQRLTKPCLLCVNSCLSYLSPQRELIVKN